MNGDRGDLAELVKKLLGREIIKRPNYRRYLTSLSHFYIQPPWVYRAPTCGIRFLTKPKMVSVQVVYSFARKWKLKTKERVHDFSLEPVTDSGFYGFYLDHLTNRPPLSDTINE